MNVAFTHQIAQAPLQQHATGGLPYRADIDGLRAVAILPVVLYHAGIPGFAGGFVGVDVFFVISGYLMASLIGGEIARGEFSLLRFYERRIRRIFPALFATITASAILAWLLLMPLEFEYFARSLKAAALFTSNFQFAKESGYFDIGAQMKPLLHTWSLAVEEQFYIVFPLALVGMGHLNRRSTVPVLFVLFLLSLAASAWMVLRTPSAAFYLSQYRVWELLLGALLALGSVPKPSRPVTRQALAALGLALIGTAIVTYSDHTLFPGLAALVPCIGAALIIHAHADSGVIGRMLHAPALVFVGLISYSLYLWHWPVVVFTRYAGGRELSLAQGGLVVIGSIVLAMASWRFIERPFRGHANRLGRTPLFAAAAFAMAAAIGLGASVVAHHGFPARLPMPVRAVYAATYDVSRFGGPDCIGDADGSGPSLADIRSGKICELGSKGAADPAFLVWGDSHSAAMAPAIDVAAAKAGLSGLIAARAACPPLPGVQLSNRGASSSCVDFNAAVSDLIASRHIPMVFLVAYWPKYIHRSLLPNQGAYFDASVPPSVADHSGPIAAGLDRLMADFSRRATKVVLVMDVPEMGRYIPEVAAKAIRDGTSTDLAPPWDYIAKRQALSRAMLTDFAARYGASVIDPLPAFCNENHCDAVRDGMPLYQDTDHITATTARRLGYLYEPLFSSLSRHTVGIDDADHPTAPRGQ